MQTAFLIPSTYLVGITRCFSKSAVKVFVIAASVLTVVCNNSLSSSKCSMIIFFWSSGTSTYLLFWKYCIVHFEAGGEWHFDYYPKQIMGSTTKQQHEQLLNCRELLQKSLTATNVFNFIIIQMLHTALVPILISVWHYCCVAVHTRIEHRVANPSWGLCWGQPQRACFVVLGFFLTNQSDMIHSLYSSETLWLIQRCPGLEVNGRLSMDFIRSWIHPTVN